MSFIAKTIKKEKKNGHYDYLKYNWERLVILMIFFYVCIYIYIIDFMHWTHNFIHIFVARYWYILFILFKYE